MRRKLSLLSKIPRFIPCLSRRRLLRLRSRPTMPDFSIERKASFISKLRILRCASLLVGISNLGLVLFGFVLLRSFVSGGCIGGDRLPFAAATLLAGLKIAAMVGAGRAQLAAAEMIVSRPMEGSVAVDAVLRHERRVRYRRWLWWTRFGMAITVLQFMGAAYLTFVIMSNLSHERSSKACFLGQNTTSKAWKRSLVVSYMIMNWIVVLVQCFTGSDILRWRSFYSTHDSAWKAYYREVFDHGIREALCCLGRGKYLTVLEEDEVYSVARLLGDLVAYRASGTGHLEFLAGLALLQMHRKIPDPQSELGEAPEELIRQAAIYHPFAEAAYTGPLLDLGRNPILFPCAWLYRQGVLTPWTRTRRPALEGDNWWRGHAAAFLRFVHIPPNALLRARVCQTKREAAFFVVALHDERTVVIAVRGTETPEDLITDGLCRECELTTDDLDGLVSEKLPESTRQRVMCTFPHYGHSGIVESARELFLRIDGPIGGNLGSEKYGFLSSLLGEGGECHGYKIRIVGHSLGGSVATLLGIRLYGRYPDLHVYSYGALPCVDLVIAEACSDFITTIVCNDEFSSRLSVNSILRLRSAAITALSDNSSADSAMIHKLARRILHVNSYHNDIQNNYVSAPPSYSLHLTDDNPNTVHNWMHNNTDSSDLMMQNGFTEHAEVKLLSSRIIPISGQSQSQSQSEEYSSSNNNNSCTIREIPVEPPEMFLAGLIIHVVREQRNMLPLWRWWNFRASERLFRAYVAKRESFRDLLVTPYMFTDHLPWRCHYAMQRVLQARNYSKEQQNTDCIEQHLV